MTAVHRKALLQVHLGAVLLAGAALFPRFLGIPATQLVALRCLIAAAILLGLTALLRHGFRVRSRRDLAWLLLCGLLMGLHWVTYYTGIQQGGVALAVVCLYTFPVITVFIEPLFGETQLRRGDILAGLAVIAGVLIVVRPGSAQSAVLLPALLCLASALFYALRNTLYRRYLRDYSPYSMMGWQFLLVGLALLPTLTTGVPLAPERWWILLLFGILFTAAPHTLFVAGMRELSAKTMGLINSMMPLYATGFAWAFLGEGADAYTLAGGALIVGASAYESLRNR